MAQASSGQRAQVEKHPVRTRPEAYSWSGREAKAPTRKPRRSERRVGNTPRSDGPETASVQTAEPGKVRAQSVNPFSDRKAPAPGYRWQTPSARAANFPVTSWFHRETIHCPPTQRWHRPVWAAYGD